MQHERLKELERQIGVVMRGGVAVAARAGGANVVTADATRLGCAIRIILSELRKEVPYDSCSVQELRDQRLIIIGGVGFADLDVVVGESFDIDSSDIPNGQVVHRRRPLIVTDTEQYRAFRRGLHVGAGIRSWLGVPMLQGHRIAGVLALDKSEPGYYTDAHAATSGAFASLVAHAILQGVAGEQQSSA